MAGDLNQSLAARLRAAGIDLSRLFDPGLGPWEAWLRLRDHDGPRATLVDLYLLEAASRGIEPDALTAADRQRLKAAARPVSYPSRAAVLPGSNRAGDPHETADYDPAWRHQFAAWEGRLARALGPAAVHIEHVGSTSVPGLAAKPIIDIQVSVPDVGEEPAYLPAAESCGLIPRMRERGHLLLWPPPARPREVHVHVCDSGGPWERRHLLFRDYLRAHPAVAEAYGALKRELTFRVPADGEPIHVDLVLGGTTWSPGGSARGSPRPIMKSTAAFVLMGMTVFPGWPNAIRETARRRSPGQHRLLPQGIRSATGTARRAVPVETMTRSPGSSPAAPAGSGRRESGHRGRHRRRP